jgi:hypothetical protein
MWNMEAVEHVCVACGLAMQDFAFTLHNACVACMWESTVWAGYFTTAKASEPPQVRILPESNMTALPLAALPPGRVPASLTSPFPVVLNQCIWTLGPAWKTARMHTCA